MKSDFEKIKEYYPNLWSKAWVRNAVIKGRITKEEYELITGETY